MSTRGSAAVLDACVLFPVVLRDVLLTLADFEFYVPKWSDRIEEEWTRNAIARAREAGRDHLIPGIERTRDRMREVFPDAVVPPFLGSVEGMDLIDAGDRHVVGTAVVCSASTIVTANLRHFPAQADVFQRYGIEVRHPDEFVMDLVDLDEMRAARAFKEMVERKKHPPTTVAELAERLASTGYPQIAAWLGSETVAALLTR